MLLDHPRSWFLPSSGNSVFTASSPLAYFRHIFSLSHAASFDSPVHATIATVPAQRWPWTGWFQLRKHETTVNWDCPKTGKEEIFEPENSRSNLGSTVSTCENVLCTLKWWPFEQANDDEPTHSMELSKTLQPRGCYLPVPSADCRLLGRKTHPVSVFPKKTGRNWMVRHNDQATNNDQCLWPHWVGEVFSGTPFFEWYLLPGRHPLVAPSRSPRSRSWVKLYKTGIKRQRA